MLRHSIENLEFLDMSFRHDQEPHLFENIDYTFPLNGNYRFKLEAGRGSSTLLQIMAGLKIGTGQYKVNGQNVFDLSFEEFLPYRLNIGYSFDYHGLLANKTLRENLLLPMRYHRFKPGREGHEWVEQLFGHMGIKGEADKRPAMVTGGTKKVACVLRALVLQPELILMDDPTTGMNADQKTMFIELIKSEQRSGHLKHCFFASQDAGFLSNFSHSEIRVTAKKLTLNDPMPGVVNI